MEYWLKERTPAYSRTERAALGHGRLESRVSRVFDSLGIMANKEKWSGNVTIIACESETVKEAPAYIPLKSVCMKAVCHRSLQNRVHWCATIGR